MKKIITSFVLIFVAALAFNGQVDAQNLSNKGTEFWVGYGHHQYMENGSNTQEMVVYLSAEQAATVTVSIYGTTWTQTYNVPANTVITTATIPKFGTTDARLYSGPCGFFPPGTACGGVGVFVNKAIHIESNVPIVAYAHIYGSASSGATMLMPVETWGFSYTTINSNQNYATNCYSWAYAIAQHDNTRIEVTLSQPSRNGLPAGVPYVVNLNKGDIYQVMVGTEAASAKPEMTGTKIKSIDNGTGNCYPIAVFAGSSRTSGAPSACGTGGGDNDNQQCFPTQAWGKRYLLAPTSSSGNAATRMTNGYKIVVKESGTLVYRNGALMTPNATGFYYFQSNQEEYITASKPIMVAQFMIGGSCMNGGVGDPEMIYLSPIEQGIKKIGFFRNTEENITVNYLTLIIPTAGLASLVIDGSSTFNHTYSHTRLPGYTVVVKRWSAAQAQSTASSDSAFTAVTYGLGSVESYGYNAGTLVNNLNAVGSIRNVSDTSSAVSHPFTCLGSPVALSVLLAYQPTQIVWQLSTLGANISPNANVTQNGPVSSGSQIINGVPYFQYDLPGTYTFNGVDTFRIPITATHPSIENCNNTEPLYFDVIVKESPKADFSITHTGCSLDPVTFNGTTPTTNGFTINQWLYTFPDATTATVQNPVKTFTSTVPVPIQLNIVSQEGCVADTLKTISIYPKPIANFTSSNDSVCVNSALNFSSTSSYAGPAPLNYFWWDFGDGSAPIIATTNTAQSHTYTNPGTYTVKHVAGVGSVCVSDTIISVISVLYLPYTSFTYPAGCLPPSGTVNFTSTAGSGDGQPITGHAWVFGDLSSGVNNTSTLANPSHNYSSFGNYTINYQTTTQFGCVKDTVVNATFNLPATFTWPALAPVCQSIAGTVSVATATVSNGVTGTGVYSGPGTDAAGNFNPSIAGPGAHIITYTFTSTAGCTSSATQTINVSNPPTANFTGTASGCLPATGLASFTYTGSNVSGETFEWNFGHPASGANNTSTLSNPTHNFTEGTYTVSVIATNANGCKDTSTQIFTYGVTPALNYPALSPVCESNPGTVSVATATVTNAVTGTGVYSGPGTDATGNFNPSTAGAGTHTITYTFTSTGNCISTITSTIVVNPKPAANFTGTASGCLPATGLASFNYTGSAAAGQTYLWNFGHPASGANNTSTLTNPTHIFTEGTYTVSVIATNANGCKDTSTQSFTYGVTPALNYPALSPVCESNPGTVSVATATITNGVTGTGVYSGPGTDEAGNFNPATAGAGTHTITYTFTSAGNCISTISSNIIVNPKPMASFTATAAVCMGDAVNISNNSTISSGTISSNTWDFGDGSAPIVNNNANFSYNYTIPGTYTITLKSQSAGGCASDVITRVVKVNAVPVAGFDTPAFVCLPGSLQFTNTSTISDGATMTYNWDFGDGTGSSSAVNPSHTYASSGTYTIRLIAISAAGCRDTITSTYGAFYDKPIALFDVTPVVLCQGTPNVFTDQSTAPNSTIANWNWDFADGSTSTSGTPSKTYSVPGNYDISLTVKNTQGCTSDPYIRNVDVNVQPVIDAGPSFVVPTGTAIQFNPTANDSTNVSFLWTPTGDIFNPAVLRPVITANQSLTYTLTATGPTGCTASDTMSVKVLLPVIIPNAFSPNGDGINDTWVLANLADYPGATVEVFNRYGQKVFTSKGYSTPWDGTYKGKTLSFATYYYIIYLNNGFKPLNGTITIVK